MPNCTIVISSLLILTHLASNAQEVRSVRLSQYTENNGLSSNYVTKIIQDQYGFIWAGTQEGLNAFSGSHFKQFSNQSDPKRNIGGSMIQDVVEDQKRSMLWIQVSYANICALDLISRTITKRLTLDFQGKGYDEIWARCINVSDDILWIGGLNTLSAYHIPTDTFVDISHLVNELNELGEYNVSKILHDGSGRIWLLDESNGILVLDQSYQVVKSLFFNELLDKELEKLRFWDATIRSDEIYIASSNGLLHFKNEKQNNLPIIVEDIPTPFNNAEILSLEYVSDTNILIATLHDVYLLNTMNNEVVKIVTNNSKNDGLPSVYQIHFDRVSNQIWLGSQSGLASFQLETAPYDYYLSTHSKDQNFRHLYAIMATASMDLYAGSVNGIYHVDQETRHIKLLDSLTTNLTVFDDSKNNIFVSSSMGFYRIKNHKIELISKMDSNLKTLESDHFNKAIKYNDSLILLSSFIQKGLTIWNTQSNITTTYHSDSVGFKIPALRTINNLYKGKNNKVFIVTEKSIIRFDPINKVNITFDVHDPDNGLIFTNFMDMNESINSYFIGTYGDGLIETDKQFNVKRIYTTRDGLSNNCIYRIFNVKDEKMVMTSNNGLSVLDLKTGKINTYYEGDGLHGNGFEQFCGYQRGNKIYAGGPGGFTVINTDLLPETSPAPLLYSTGIHIDTQDGKIDSTHLFMSSFTIPNDAFKTTLNFVAPDYKNPQRMTYRYKIKELSNEWVDLGNQNFVDLIGINPGTYHFEVTATNSVGMDSEPLEIELNFLPKWYQTFWFKLLLLVAIVILIYLIQRYRMTQIRNQQRIRTEIANDLHDDIGSTLNSLKIFTHLAQYEPDNKGHLSQIEKSITNATVGLRDMIWVLEGEQDSVYDLVERIKKFAHPVCLADDIIFETKVDAESDLLISKKIKRNLLLIAKECINNSIKYAKCKHIKVILEYAKPNLKMTIMDDGKGFNLEEANMGKGLESIQYRARQIQFECKIETAKGQGTKTILVSK